GEDAAAAYLERAGMAVEARNWRCPVGEVDIVARDGSQLVLVEVKTRRSERAGSAEEAVSAAKRKRLVRLAEAYLSSGAHRAERVRFDVVAIRVIADDKALLRHYRDAFEVPT
ncbi:MAG TPA: YraN family protein, partial [Coriobacteriia bacterium]